MRNVKDTDEREKRPLWQMFKRMTPEERNDYLQVYFSEALLNEPSFTLKLATLRELMKSFEISTRFEALRLAQADNPLFPLSDGALLPVPRELTDGDTDNGE